MYAVVDLFLVVCVDAGPSVRYLFSGAQCNALSAVIKEDKNAQEDAFFLFVIIAISPALSVPLSWCI